MYTLHYTYKVKCTMIYTYVGSSTMNELENDFAQNSVKLTLTSSIDKKETSN